LYKRGLNKEIIDEYGFGYATKQGDLIYKMATNHENMFGEERDKSLIFSERELLDAGLILLTSQQKIIDFFIDRIVIPIKDNNGYVVGFSGRTLKEGASNKYLNTSTTKLFSKANVLFNFDKVKTLNPTKLIIVEGPMDALAYIRAGHRNVIATMGTALSSHHLNLLKSLTNLETIILSFDNDDAGNFATVQHGKSLMENGFNTFVIKSFDKQYKDVDDLLNAKGLDAINEILDQRKDFVTFLIENEFAKNKPLDEIQKSTNYIIECILNFGDNSLLLRTRNLKLLSEKSGFDFEDLLNKFNKDEQKIYPQAQNNKKIKISIPNNDVGLDEKFKEKDDEVVHPSLPVVSNISKLIKDNENEKKLISKSLVSAYDYLISILLIYPQSIDYFESEVSLTTNFEFIEQETILKTIRYFKLMDKPINEMDVLNFMKQRSEEGKNTVSKNYHDAFKYLTSHLTSINHEFFKSINTRNMEQRLQDTVYKLQLQKYDYSINCKLNEIYKLYVKNSKQHADQINILFSEINNLKQKKVELTKIKTKNKKYK
jgi:DNA primase